MPLAELTPKVWDEVSAAPRKCKTPLKESTFWKVEFHFSTCARKRFAALLPAPPAARRVTEATHSAARADGKNANFAEPHFIYKK